MNSSSSLIKFNNFINSNEIKNSSLLNFQNKQLGKIINNKSYNFNLSGIVNDFSTADTELSFKNNILKEYAQSKNGETYIFLKKVDKFVNELFRIYSQDNSLCNFLLFEKSVNININLENEKKKKLLLSDYFDIFNNADFLSTNIPFIEKDGKLTHNAFNPTLSSMTLVIKSYKKINEKKYEDFVKNNFSVTYLDNKLIKIEFNETNPPFYRDTLDSKIKIINKIIGKKKIFIDDIIKEKSVFSILWTPADTNKINSSFLSFYNFDFYLIGNLIIKRNDKIWFSNFIINYNNNIKDFKKDYLINVNNIEKFIKENSQINGDNKIFFSNDYKRYKFNY